MFSVEDTRVLHVLDLVDRTRAFLGRRDRGRAEASRNLEAFYETVWREAAAVVGATVEDLGNGALEIRRGSLSTRVLGNTTAIDHLATHCVVRTKPVIYRLLSRAGLPVPRHLAFEIHELARAYAFLDSAKGPCVVKPASGTGGGEGVTTGIRTRWQLARAAWNAARRDRHVLIEDFVDGDNYRLLYLDGRLLDAVVREAPWIRGDGRRSVAALIRAENERRLRQSLSHGLITFDLDLERTLARHGLGLNSVPELDRRIQLKTAVNENNGRDNRSATEWVGRELLEQGALAARVAGVRLAGVDVITPDPGVSLRQSGGVMLEVNSPPGFFWHYLKRDGPFPVAVHLLNALLPATECDVASGSSHARR